MIRYRQGDMKRVVHRARRALALDAGAGWSLDARRMLGTALEILGRRQAARPEFERLLRDARDTWTKEQARCRLVSWGLSGTKAPPLAASAWVRGTPVGLNDLRGKVVLLFFFSVH